MSLRPLHSLVDHEWNPRNVRRFFLVLLASLESWFGWGITAWHNTYNARTNIGANNANGAVVAVIVFGIVLAVLCLVHLWAYEEDGERHHKDEETLEQRIARKEREALIDVD